MSIEPRDGEWLHGHPPLVRRPPEGGTRLPLWQTLRAPLQRDRAVGYAVALLIQGAAVSLTRQLDGLWPGFAFPGALALLGVAGVALYWGTGPSVLATLGGAALLNYAILRPQGAWSLQGAQVAATLLFVAVGLSIGALASRSERARRTAQVAALQATQSYGAERAQREQAEQATHRLHALTMVLDTALAPTNLDDLLQNVLGRVTAALAVDNTAILLLDEEAQQLVVHLARGPEDALAGRMRVPVGQGFAGQIAASRQPLIVADTSTVPVVNPFLHEQLRSLLGVPLLVEGRLIGVMHVGTATPRHFTPEDVEMVQLMAERVALAVEHARLYSAERAARAEAEQAVRLRDDVVALATHDLVAPLASVDSRAQLIRYRLRRNHPLEAAWLEAQLDGIDGAIARMSATIDELRDVARLQIGQALELACETVEMGALLRGVGAEYNAGPDATPVAVDAPAEAVLVRGDRARLTRVLHNLIGNALKYSPANTPVRVTVQGRAHEALITVHDTGVGIPAGDLPRIFTRYFRAANAQGLAGTGLGLWGAKAIVEQHGGQLALESGLGQGTTVTLRLPRLPHADDESAV